MALLIAAALGLGMLTLLFVVIVGPFLLIKMPKINAAITMEARLAELEARVDRMASRLATISKLEGTAPLRVDQSQPASPSAPVAARVPPTQAPLRASDPAPRAGLDSTSGAFGLGPGNTPRLSSAGVSGIASSASATRPNQATATQSAPRVSQSTSDVESASPAPGMEEVFGANWLNKIGASILVLGVALFLGYELQGVGPAGKAFVGYAVAASLLGAGIFLERRTDYRLFSRGTTGAGWALLFFTTYAINHVPATRILPSTTADLILMFGVAAGMVAHTLHYRSQTVTSLAFLLAFLTVTISHDTVFSLSAGVVLACAAAAIANRTGWRALEIGAIAATYLNHFVWLQPVVAHARGGMFAEFWMSMLMLLLYWAIFRTAYVARRPTTDADERWSTVAAVLNSGLLLMTAWYQSTRPDVAFWGLLALGATEALLAQLPPTRQRRTAFVTLTTLGVTMAVAALPFRFGGVRLSILWLAEAEALVFIAAFTRETLFHRLGVLTSAIVGEQILMVAMGAIGSSAARSATGPGQSLGFTLLTAAGAFYVNGHFVPRRWSDLFVAEVDPTIATCFSCVGSAFVLLAAWYELTPLGVALAWAFVGLVLMESGLRLRTRHLRMQGYAALALSFARVFVVNLNAVGGPGVLSPRLYSIVPLGLAYLWAYRRLDLSPGDAPELGGFAAPTFSCMATLVFAALAWSELSPERVVIGWAVMVVALLIAATLLERRVFVGQATAGALGVAARGIFHNLYGRSYFDVGPLTSPTFAIGLTAILFIAALPLAFHLRDRSRGPGTDWLRRVFDRRPEQVIFFTALALVTLLLKVQLPAGYLTIGWSLEAFAVMLFALPAQERSFRISALVLLAICVARIVAIDAWSLDPRDRYLTFIGLGGALLAVSFLYSRYRQLVREYL